MFTARIPRVWLDRLKRHRAWILVGLTVLLVLLIRVRLREMPLERDEGEYAYAGQLMLQGIPPYKEAYNMKLPGTYAAYAVIMALFGQSASAIHLGLALVSAGSVVLMFLIGRKLMDETTGIVAAIVFALLSLSPSVLGLAAHATHFVTLFALGGIWVLLKGLESTVQSPQSKVEPRSPLDAPTLPRSTLLFLSGVLFGLAFLMKQHGIFFGIFGGVYLIWTMIAEVRGQKSEVRGQSRRRPRSTLYALTLLRSTLLRSTLLRSTLLRSTLLRSTLLYSAGCLLPYALTCLILWQAGVFHQFVFWTISYASKYASNVPIAYAPAVLGPVLPGIIGLGLGLWLLAGAGAVLMWWGRKAEDRTTQGTDTSVSVRNPKVEARFFLIALLICSTASVSVGFHFRPHYFITLLPVLALFCGIAVSRGFALFQHDDSIEPLLAGLERIGAISILGTFLVGALTVLLGNGQLWFAPSSAEASWAVYHSSELFEAVRIADYLKSNSSKSARIAVIGSEPEIYFYAHRRSATGYIYTYPLMEPQPYALKMQEEMIGEIERARPEWVVYVNDDLSWLPFRASERKIFDWWKGYWDKNLDMISMTPIKEGAGEEEAKPAANKEGDQKYIMLLKRKADK